MAQSPYTTVRSAYGYSIAQYVLYKPFTRQRSCVAARDCTVLYTL